MLKWFAMSLAGAGLGYATVYFALGVQPESHPQPESSAVVAEQPAAPILLAEVVEVTDTDPLLDPQPGHAAGLPFDPAESAVPVRARTSASPAPIPLAVD